MTWTPWTSESKDFRHSTVKEDAYVRVRALIKRIENHPHRNELEADLMQDKVYNPFSENSKKSTTLTMWSTSNCARPLQKCNARAVCLIGQKARVPHGSHAQAESKTIRYLIDFELRDFKRNDMDNPRSRPTITKPFNAWKRCRKKKDAAGQKLHKNSREIFEGSAVPSITRRNWMVWSIV